MEQKDYKYEVVAELLGTENHIRGLARALNTNHMAIVRKIKALSRENIVDYRLEGKNKVYFLKDSLEALAYAFMTENYKLVKTLQRYPALRGIFEKLQKENKIRLAILFGSYAKGLAKPQSDIDVYIETTDKRVKQNLELINTKLSVKIGKYDRSSLLIKEIEKNHILIKGAENYYEKRKFFE